MLKLQLKLSLRIISTFYFVPLQHQINGVAVHPYREGHAPLTKCHHLLQAGICKAHTALDAEGITNLALLQAGICKAHTAESDSERNEPILLQAGICKAHTAYISVVY